MPISPLGLLGNATQGGARLPEPDPFDFGDLSDPKAYAAAMAKILSGQGAPVADERDLLQLQLQKALQPQEQKKRISTAGTVFGGLSNILGGVQNGMQVNALTQRYKQNAGELAAAGQKKSQGAQLLELLGHTRDRQEGAADRTASQTFSAGEAAKGRNFQREMHAADRAFEEKKLTAAEEAAKAKAEADKKGDVTKVEGSFRNDILGNQVTKDALQAQTALKTVDTALKAKTPAGDMAAIFAFMKAQDPNSSVREGEYANAQNAANVPDQIRNLYNKALAGTLLTEDQRADFLGRTRDAARIRADAYRKFVDPYSRAVSEAGGDPTRVLPGIDFSALDAPAQAAPAANLVPITRNGQTRMWDPTANKWADEGAR